MKCPLCGADTSPCACDNLWMRFKVALAQQLGHEPPAQQPTSRPRQQTNAQWPKTREQLITSQCAPPRYPTTCKACAAPIEFWKTPAGKFLPLVFHADDHNYTPHWQDCPNAKEFQKR